jgi:two-component system nitrogen regulation sensor histidine kinase NtrY
MTDEVSPGKAHGNTLQVTSEPSPDFVSGSGRRDAAAMRRVAMWAGRTNIGRRLALVLMVVGVTAGIATFLTLTGNSNFGMGDSALDVLVAVDLVLVLALGAVVVHGLVRLWGQRRSGLAAARMHVRLVGLFSIVAIVPAILAVVLAALFFNVTIQNWFSDRVRQAVESSVRVSEAYLSEHEQIFRSDAFAMSGELNRIWPQVATDSRRIERSLEVLTERHSVHGALLLDPSGRILSQAGFTSSLTFDLPPAWAYVDSNGGEPVVLVAEARDRVRALVGLDVRPKVFLYVGRFIDPNVLELRETTQRAARDYALVESELTDLQIELAAIFVIVTLLLLMTAVGLAFVFANRLTRPIASLVHAAEMVRSGNLGVRLAEAGRSDDEIGMLTRAFNRMTRQLEEQRGELTEANRQLEDRRRFTEAVLGGVSAGVVGLDSAGRVSLPNRSATGLLGLRLDELMGRQLGECVPELADLIALAVSDPERLVEDEVSVESGTDRKTLHVRIAAEHDAHQMVIGFVVTFDDVTELQSAQRKAAWADVARRIAHEIKNPLTPIQLSAERLKRKYLKEVKSDPEVFAQCTDTIVRQVGDIGRMVDEFSAFARMPNPVVRPVNLVKICRDAVFLQDQARADIRFETDFPDTPVLANCDSGLVSQALTNLLQNAVDAIVGRPDADGDAPREPGLVRMQLTATGNMASILVEDNGRGLPVEERDRLTEPYVTTRSKGTGLGLAIVSRIVEQHGGTLTLEDRGEGLPGARIVLTMQVDLPQSGNEETDEPSTDT